MILHRLALLLLFFILTNGFTSVISDIHAEIRDFQTTRLKSTAGAGVGSLLLEEASFLNPASLAFFHSSSVYYQNMNGGRNIQSDNGINTNNKSEATAFILTDTGGGLNGSFSYIKQKENLDKREQFGVAFASSLGDQSSFGVTALIIKDKLYKDGILVNEEYEQYIFGVTHILSEEFSFGVSIIDVFRAQPEDSKVIFGMQYVYESFLSVMIDIGSDYKSNLEENYTHKTAGQVRFLDNFFLRFGVFNDKGKSEKGSGIGISWVTPKLAIDFSQNSIKKLTTSINVDSDKISEANFSVSYRF